MNIGIDIDGVLTDLESVIKNYGTKFCVEEKLPIEINEINYKETETFNWTEEQAEKFWNKYFIKYVMNGLPRDFAKEILDKLQEEGNKIYLITARNEYGLPPEYYGKIQELTKDWLKKNEIKYEKIIFAKDKDKVIECVKNDVEIMIEDSPKNILNISKEIPVIKYACEYNEKVQGENIIKAYSWYHIYDIIKNKTGSC